MITFTEVTRYVQRMFTRYAWALIPCLLLVACAPAPGSQIDTPVPGSETQVSIPASSTPSMRETRPTKELPDMVPTDTGAEASPVTGEVPDDLLAAIVADLAARENVLAEEINVVRGQEVIWPDGSLGCAQPGMMYTQAQVSGYWVVLRAGESEYDYRASATGYFILCEGAGSTPGLSPDR